MTHRKFSHDDIHRALIRLVNPEGKAIIDDANQPALFCPYYVPLTGVLKYDWGVIVSPDSLKFGQLVFEHHACGCPEGAHGEGRQRRDEWLKKQKAGE